MAAASSVGSEDTSSGEETDPDRKGDRLDNPAREGAGARPPSCDFRVQLPGSLRGRGPPALPQFQAGPEAEGSLSQQALWPA